MKKFRIKEKKINKQTFVFDMLKSVLFETKLNIASFYCIKCSLYYNIYKETERKDFIYF